MCLRVRFVPPLTDKRDASSLASLSDFKTNTERKSACLQQLLLFALMHAVSMLKDQVGFCSAKLAAVTQTEQFGGGALTSLTPERWLLHLSHV